MNTIKKLAALGLAAPLLATPASAHHSLAMFDLTHCKTITGTVDKLEWNYPHSWLWIKAPEPPSPAPVWWGFEFMSPSQAHAIDPRWTKTVVKKGDIVTVTFGPLRDGRNGGAVALVKIPDGHVLGGTPGICGTASRYH